MNTFDVCFLWETFFTSTGIGSGFWGVLKGAVDRGDTMLPLPKKGWVIGWMLLGLPLESQVALTPIDCLLSALPVSIQRNICDHWLPKESKKQGKATVPSEYKISSFYANCPDEKANFKIAGKLESNICHIKMFHYQISLNSHIPKFIQ